MKKILSFVLVLVLLIMCVPIGAFSVSAATTETTYAVGDIVEFGSYKQSAIKNANGETTGFNVEPLKWRILKIENGKALLLTEEVIDNKYYNSTSATVDGYYGNNYAHSDIREWLINDFYNAAFSSAEKNCILATTLDNSAAPTSVNASGSYTKYSSESTTDKVFLLSKDEANTYASKYFRTTATDYALSLGYQLYSGAGSIVGDNWTLRTAGNNTYQIYTVHVRWGEHVTYFNWYDDTITTPRGVRPAIYVDLNNYSNSNQFFDNQSSEYSYLMGESWKNAGMENINEYLMTFPSISKAVLDSYNSNQEFIDSVAGWKFMEYMFEPGETVNDALNMKDYYSAILLSLIDSEIMDENYIKTIEESSKFEYAKLFSKFTDIIKSCDEIDHEKLLSNGTCTIEEITALNNKINSLDGVSSKISDVSSFLSTGKTINDSINLCINYYNVCNTSKYIVNVLKKVQANSSNMFLSMAIDDIVNATEDSFDYVTSGFIAGSANVAKDYGVDKINDAWESVLNSTTFTKGALLGYKIGKPLSNVFLSTDSIISNYFEFTALYEVEKAIKATIKDFETEFYNKVDADSSLNYINTVALYFKTYYLSCDYATNLAKYRNLCPFGYIFYNGKQNFEEASNQFNTTRNSLKEYENQLFRLWTYSLKGRYPEIYSEIAPSLSNIYSTDLSTALVRLEYLSKTYTGEEFKPSVTVTVGNAVLLPNEYTVSYCNNIAPGIATVKITAAENSIYTGEKTVEFTIKEAPFVKRLSIRGSVSQISMFNLCDTEEEQENNGIVLPDVYFYENGTIVASVENGVITNDDLPIFVSENGIDILMQDKDYTVKINGNPNQLFNTEIQKLNEELSAIETSNYNNLMTDNEIQCNIYAEATDEVIVNNEILQADFSSTNIADKQQYTIYSEQCVTENTAYENQRVYVSAIIPEGNIFVGWSVSPNVLLSSNSSVSSFIMPSEDVYISAGFIINQAYFNLKETINKASNIGPGKYTKTSYEELQMIIGQSKLVLENDISEELSQEKILEIQTAIQSLEEIQPLNFKGASLTLHHNLAINYKVDKALFDTVGYTNPCVVFEIGGKKTTVKTYAVEGDRYVFRFRNIAPNQMNDTIYATLYATYNGVEYASETKEYSVAEYCYSTLNKYATDDYAELRTLLVDLLHYGTQSQLYTKYNVDNLVNANLTETQLAWGTADDPTLTNSLNTAYETVENPLITWKGASLNLNDSVSMRFKFITEDIAGLSLKITSDTDEWNITANNFVLEDGVYSVRFSGLNAGQMSEKVYLTMYKDGIAVSNTVCYSIESYAYSKQDSTIEHLSELVKAMMKYGNSAHSYVN